MAEVVLNILTSDTGDERVVIVRRADGAYACRREWRDQDGWGESGPDLGIYDSADSAEAEARMRVSWLVPAFH